MHRQNKQVIEYILLISIIILPFVAGYIFNDYKIPAFLFLLGTALFHVVRERIQSNISGEGVRKITVGSKAPPGSS
jgi:uncharacterized membrane protein